MYPLKSHLYLQKRYNMLKRFQSTMGNSGSVHHMQSSLKELHSYYQVQNNEENVDELSYPNKEPSTLHTLERDKSLPRCQFSRIPSANNRSSHKFHASSADATAKNSQIKVLPTLTQNFRLRSTTNGAILQTGGTISGRKESLLPQPMPLMERSKTFISESSRESFKENNAMRAMSRRSQTQLNIDLSKMNTENPVGKSHFQYKRYNSQVELSASKEVEKIVPNPSECNSIETYQKLSKAKIKNKKRKAPPVPPVSSIEKHPTLQRQAAGASDSAHKEIERKQRIFKTKSETILQGSLTRPPAQINSKIKSTPKTRTQPTIERLIPIQRSKIVEPASGFRREKSFDAALMLRNKTIPTTVHPEPKTLNSTKRKSLQPLGRADFKTESSDFKAELAAATKFRMMMKNTDQQDFKSSGREASTRQREPNIDKPKPVKLQSTPAARQSSKSETQSKIPQLKKTFYFGMENAKRKTVDSSQTNTYTPKQKDKQLQPLPQLPQTLHDEISSTSTFSFKDNDPVYALNDNCNSEINDNGIQVSVRPTLPRRQLEIPRFSPVAAWRTLTDEYRKHALEPTSSPLSSNIPMEVTDHFLVEDRIYRTYREPCPFYPDNKSGDSGISGDDAYLPEKPIQPRHHNECDELMGMANIDGYAVNDPSMKVVGPFLTPWTPQQDLEGEDTSSDGDVAVKLVEPESPSLGAHVFSLSLPRENQQSVYGEKNKPDFRSLQKLKRSGSGSGCECTQSSDSNLFGNVCLGNYRSDNWVLSKTGVPPKNDPPVTCRNQTDSNKKSAYMDLSVSIQPMSLGCLATGKHVMYLPNRPIQELKRQSLVVPPSDRQFVDEDISKNAPPVRNKRYSFQSTALQIERRRLAESLSKDAEKKEELRKSELEAMIRVEEEFQRKRAHEKASIRHQLRLYSMDDDNFTSLPADYLQNCNGLRAEPDGAVSSTSASPILRTNETNSKDDGAYLLRKRNVENDYRFKTELEMLFANS